MNKGLEGTINDNAIRVWQLTGVMILSPSILILATLLVLSFLVQWPIWIFTAVLILSAASILLLVIIIPKLRFQRWSYAIDEQSIEMHHGIWLWKKTLIPMVRVQHIDLKQGPLLRRYGLASVYISTAAGTHRIPALAESQGEQIRQQILTYAEVSNEDI